MFGIKFEQAGSANPSDAGKTIFQLWKEAFGFTNTSLALTVLVVGAVNLLFLAAVIAVAVWVLRAMGVGV